MALTNEELQKIDEDFKELIDSMDNLSKDQIKEKLVSLKAKLKREVKDVEKK